ncbi:MAG: hypothetical protein RQ748_04950 [Elusimicrobiales bacterium]|nr:hypothetical protein [Elusimicrobiales bacterium]
MTGFNLKDGPTRVLLALGLVSLTLVSLAGIKFMMSDGDSGTLPASGEPLDIFSASENDAPPPELSPLSRSENPGGGSLDMFSETNAGYYGEDEPDAEAAAVVPKAKVAKSTAAASKKTAAAARTKKKAATTAVPRMKMVPFKSITPTNVAPSGAGGAQGIPDFSTIMKQAQEQAGSGD